MRVGVQPLKLVFVISQRVKKRLLFEPASHPEMNGICSHGIQIRQDFGHPAKFHLQHLLHSLLVEPVYSALCPRSHPLDNLQGFLVVTEHVHVKQACHDLVERVVRSPHTLAVLDSFDELFREGAEVSARSKRSLALCQCIDDLIPLVLHPDISRRGKHQGTGRKIMTGKMASKFTIRSFPTTKRLCIG